MHFFLYILVMMHSLLGNTETSYNNEIRIYFIIVTTTKAFCNCVGEYFYSYALHSFICLKLSYSKYKIRMGKQKVHGHTNIEVEFTSLKIFLP